jgi:nucleotide-binding universal stress UspA family protein
MLGLAAGMIVIASMGKFSGAFIGGTLGGMTWRESLALGCGMNARGSTEVIVATLGVTMGVLSQGLFTTIVVMAIVTTMAMPPMLRWALSLVPLRPDEQQRLDREAAEAAGFVSNFERLLVAVDQSPSGRQASRLAGSLAGAGRIVTTVLPVDDQADDEAAPPEPAEEPGDAVKVAGEQVVAPGADPSRPAPPLSVETRRPNKPIEDAVPEHAEKGFDFLVVGVEPAFEGGHFSERVTRVTQGFDGPCAIVVTRGFHRDDPDRVEREILVPVTGTPYSRHGAELALAFAQANKATVTAINVAGSSREPASPNVGSDRNQAAILREIVLLGEHMDVAVKLVPRRGGTPEQTILHQMKLRPYDVVVMGVSRLPGDALAFGDVADAILEHAEKSIVLVSS